MIVLLKSGLHGLSCLFLGERRGFEVQGLCRSCVHSLSSCTIPDFRIEGLVGRAWGLGFGFSILLLFKVQKQVYISWHIGRLAPC